MIRLRDGTACQLEQREDGNRGEFQYELVAESRNRKKRAREDRKQADP